MSGKLRIRGGAREVILFCMILLACESEEKIPSDILTPERMVSILSDVHIAEARVTQMKFKSMDSSVVVYDYLQKEIYKKYKTDSTEYKRSYDFYVSNPKMLEEIYSGVERKLLAREKKSNIKL